MTVLAEARTRGTGGEGGDANDGSGGSNEGTGRSVDGSGGASGGSGGTSGGSGGGSGGSSLTAETVTSKPSTQCDDDNAVNGDTCSNECTLTACDTCRDAACGDFGQYLTCDGYVNPENPSDTTGRANCEALLECYREECGRTGDPRVCYCGTGGQERGTQAWEDFMGTCFAPFCCHRPPGGGVCRAKSRRFLARLRPSASAHCGSIQTLRSASPIKQCSANKTNAPLNAITSFLKERVAPAAAAKAALAARAAGAHLVAAVTLGPVALAADLRAVTKGTRPAKSVSPAERRSARTSGPRHS